MNRDHLAVFFILLRLCRRYTAQAVFTALMTLQLFRSSAENPPRVARQLEVLVELIYEIHNSKACMQVHGYLGLITNLELIALERTFDVFEPEYRFPNRRERIMTMFDQFSMLRLYESLNKELDLVSRWNTELSDVFDEKCNQTMIYSIMTRLVLFDIRRTRNE